MPKTLLLADDSVTIQKVVGISFANEDVVLLTVDNGDDAIARAKEARPDVVLADVVMPGKNGYEVCQAIKADPALANTPVLLLTGTFEAFDEQRAARAGADGHITKPFEAQSLVDKVNALLARPAAGPAAAAAEAAPARVPIGVLRPARPEAPAPAPVSHTADTAYDFFDEEVTAPRPSAGPREDTTVLLEPAAPAAPAPASPDFGFDGEDITGPEPTPEPAAALPFAPAAPFAGAASEAPPVHAPGEAEPYAPTGGLESSPSFGSDDLGFEPSPGEPAEGARPSLFDGGFPAAAAPAEPAERAETRLLGDAFEAPAAFDPGATRLAGGFDPGATRLGEAEAPAPLDALDELDLDGGVESHAGFGEAVFDPSGARDYDVSSSDLGAPLAEPAPRYRDEGLEPEPPAAWATAWPEPVEASAAAPLHAAAPAPTPAPAFEPASGPAPGALDAAARSSALGRDELRDMLEKMAWEAFGPLTERLVRDAVDRIERVAWEVIPQLAETLIREEIRKLKGE